MKRKKDKSENYLEKRSAGAGSFFVGSEGGGVNSRDACTLIFPVLLTGVLQSQTRNTDKWHCRKWSMVRVDQARKMRSTLQPAIQQILRAPTKCQTQNLVLGSQRRLFSLCCPRGLQSRRELEKVNQGHWAGSIGRVCNSWPLGSWVRAPC